MSLNGAMTRIERPQGVPPTLLFRYPGEHVPHGARLGVRPDECAVFTSHGKVLGVIGPGDHVLAVEQHRFLEPTVDIVSGGGALACEIYWIATGIFSGVVVQGSLGKIKDESGKELPLWFSASLTVQARDPEALVRALDSRQGDPIEAVKFVAARALRTVVDRLVKRGDIVPTTISRESGKVKRAAEEDGLGLGEVGVELLRIDQLDVMREAPMQPGAAPARAPQPYPGPQHPVGPYPRPGQPPPQYPPGAVQFGAAALAPASPYPPPPSAGPAGHVAYPQAPYPQQPYPQQAYPQQPAGGAELGWAIPSVPHADQATGLVCPIHFWGSFVGTPVPRDHVQWVIDSIGEALFGLARNYSGNVLDIPGQLQPLTAMLNEQVLPGLRQAGLEGQVIVNQVELPPTDPAIAELMRRTGMR